MSRQQPLHPTTEIAVVVRPEDQMKMIGHEDIAQNAHGQLEANYFHDAQEGAIIFILVKDLGPTHCHD